MNYKKNMQTMKKGRDIGLAIVLIILLTTVIPIDMSFAQAAEEKTIAGLGTKVIADPTSPADADTVWTGNYVYFGSYDGESVKYRVLDSDSTDFGGTSMLLDCDTVLWKTDRFDADNNEWETNELKTYLNETFLLNSFSVLEQNAIIESRKNEASNTDGNGIDKLDYVPLNGEKIFFLDAKEATNTTYGYSNTGEDVKSRYKSGGTSYWWLRSKRKNSSNHASCVYYGYINNSYVLNINIWASPALNLNQASVLFSSEISENNGNGGISYKLTLKDDNMTIASDGRVTRSGNIVTIPYVLSGTNSVNVTQISVLILDKEYTEGNTNDANVLDYAKLNVSNLSATGTGTYTMPFDLQDKECGSDYYVYIVAEDVNGEKQTDYASAPVKIPHIFNEISSVTITEITEPVEENDFDTLATFDTETIAEAEVVWLENDNEVSGCAAYDTVYTVKITLTAKDTYSFSEFITATINGNSAIATLNNDGTLSVTYMFQATEKRKIVNIEIPSLPTENVFTNYYTAGDVLNSTELGNEAVVTLEGSLVPIRVNMDVEWSLEGVYDETPDATNTFKWTIVSTEYADYDLNNVLMYGTVTIQNKAYTVIDNNESDNSETYEEVVQQQNTETNNYQSTIVPIPPAYVVVEEENNVWIQSAEEDLSFKSTGDLSKILGVKVDGEYLDTEEFVIMSELGIISINAEYLQSLCIGKHSMEIVCLDGVVTTEFVIKTMDDVYNNNEKNVSSEQQTMTKEECNTVSTQVDGTDLAQTEVVSQSIWLYILLSICIVLLIGIWLFVLYKKKKEKI